MTTVRTIYEGESQVNAFDFSGAVPPGALAISSATLTAHEVHGNRLGSDVSDVFLVSTSGAVDGATVAFQFENPEPGKVYRVLCTATYDDGQKVTGLILYQVDDGL